MEEQLKLFGSISSEQDHKASSKDKKVVESILTQVPEKETKTTPPHPITLMVFVDGAARGNPGPSGAGIYITTQDRVPLIKKGYYLRHKTNNQAEYLALILACLHIQALIKNEPATRVIFHSDSQLLVRQIQGMYKVKNEILIILHQVAQKLLRQIPYSIKHVMREENINADKLANLGVDKKVKITQAMAGALSALGITVD